LLAGVACPVCIAGSAAEQAGEASCIETRGDISALQVGLQSFYLSGQELLISPAGSWHIGFKCASSC
jgi:hypothetical protein